MYFILITLVLLLVVYHGFGYYTFFTKRGIPHLSLSFRQWQKNRKEHVYKLYHEAYLNAKGKSPIGGFYVNFTPFIIVLDLDLIKNILVKDFSAFVNRGVYNNTIHDPIASTLDTLEGASWARMRKILSPAFSSAKIKAMFPIMAKKSKVLVQVIEKGASNSELYLKSILNCFTSDVAGTCAFGLDCNSLINPNDHIIKIGTEVFSSVRIFTLSNSLKMEFKKLTRFLGVRRLPLSITEFYRKVVGDTIKYRADNSIQVEDFLGFLLQLQKTKNELSFEEIVAMSMDFFVAGFESSANTINYIIYHLAMDQDIQDKVRDGILTILSNYENEVPYESVTEMKYLDLVLSETLRMHPVTPQLFREAVKNYRCPITNSEFKKGDLIVISVHALNMDEEIIPEPERFNPDRFDNQKRMPHNFLLSFGYGPRNCIGERFAVQQIKTAVIHIVKEFKITTTAKTPKEIIYSNKYHMITSEQKLYLNFEKIF